MVGFVRDIKVRPSPFFRSEGNLVALLGASSCKDIFNSEFARLILKMPTLAVPPLRLEEEKALARVLIALWEKELIESAHDCSEGGLAQTLIESCLGPNQKNVGMDFEIPQGESPVAFLFGEYAARAVISFSLSQSGRIQEVAKAEGVPFALLGKTKGNTIRMGASFEMKLDIVRKRHFEFLERV
jgi:phosphoribosylformylglycinamidine synthase